MPPPMEVYRFLIRFLAAFCIVAFLITIVLSVGYPDAVDARALSENVCMMSLTGLLGIITGNSVKS